MIAEQLHHLLVDISSLKHDPANARTHNRKNIEAIKASLDLFGQRTPIVAQRSTMVVRSGNGRLAAAKELGWDKIACILVDDDNATATAYAIADNHTATLAEWDDEILTRLLDDVDEDIKNMLKIDVPKIAEDEALDTEQQLGSDLEYKVVVDCLGEAHQAELLSDFENKGLKCRALIS